MQLVETYCIKFVLQRIFSISKKIHFFVATFICFALIIIETNLFHDFCHRPTGSQLVIFINQNVTFGLCHSIGYKKKMEEKRLSDPLIKWK